MSFPPLPSGFNTYYNTGYKRFWGSGGFPYVENDFTGGSIVQYPSDDEVRALPVMDLQNIAPKKGGRKKKKKESEKANIEDLEGGKRRRGKKKASGKTGCECDEMEGGAKSGGKKKISVKDVMDYKVKKGVSLKEAWAHFKKN